MPIKIILEYHFTSFPEYFSWCSRVQVKLFFPNISRYWVVLIYSTKLLLINRIWSIQKSTMKIRQRIMLSRAITFFPRESEARTWPHHNRKDEFYGNWRILVGNWRFSPSAVFALLVALHINIAPYTKKEFRVRSTWLISRVARICVPDKNQLGHKPG